MWHRMTRRRRRRRVASSESLGRSSMRDWRREWQSSRYAMPVDKRPWLLIEQAPFSPPSQDSAFDYAHRIEDYTAWHACTRVNFWPRSRWFALDTTSNCPSRSPSSLISSDLLFLFLLSSSIFFLSTKRIAIDFGKDLSFIVDTRITRLRFKKRNIWSCGRIFLREEKPMYEIFQNWRTGDEVEGLPVQQVVEHTGN